MAAPAKSSIDASAVPGARRARQPSFLAPQLATLVTAAPTGKEWIHEIKLDGYRLLAVKSGKRVNLLTRTRKDWSQRFSVIARVVASLPMRAAILDGEVVAADADGQQTFQALQNHLRSGQKAVLRYYVFDLLHCDGVDLTAAALLDRKALLHERLGGVDALPLRYCDHVEGGGPRAFEAACRQGLEGIISKRKTGMYTARRTPDWQKVKCIQRQEFVIVGFTDPQGARAGFGALLLGYYQDGSLRYCGRVGTGFSHARLLALFERLRRLELSAAPLDIAPHRRWLTGPLHWVRPELVCEVAFREWTSDGLLRQPVFLGLREDKAPTSVTIERPVAPSELRGTRRTLA